MDLPTKRSPPYRRRSTLWVRIRYRANTLLSRYPRALKTTKLFWRIGKLILKELRKNLAISAGTLKGGYRGTSDADKVRLIDLRSIIYCTLREFPVIRYKGRVIGGDWDLLEKKFQDLDIYIALREVIKEGKDWPDTISYQRTLELLQSGRKSLGCRNREELNQKCMEFERLYRTVKATGYKLQCEIYPPWRGKYCIESEEEVGVSVGRHGDLLFCDGAHRLSIAKLLGLPLMPVEIVVRHPEWFHFRKNLLMYANKHGGVIDQPLLHPDLMHIPSRYDCETIFSLIKENLSVKSGLLLDVNANFGFFCHKFEDEGFDCLALEDSEELLYFLERLKRAGNKQFRILTNSSREEHANINTRCKVVLALYFSDCPTKKRNGQVKHIESLTKLLAEELFFLYNQCEQPSTVAAGRIIKSSDIIQFLTSNSPFSKARCLGVLENGLALYKLSTCKK